MGPICLRLRVRSFPLGLHVGQTGGPGNHRRDCRGGAGANRLDHRRMKSSLQMRDNIHWISEAAKEQAGGGLAGPHPLCRLLKAGSKIAAAFNEAIREGKIIRSGCSGRDHHDVSGTDSPYRETSNIYDGSAFTADMAVQNVIGDGFRGATWVSIHNGGGVGWGEVINGGFGMLLDGTPDADRRLRSMLHWDVNNGIARRAWARNDEALFAIKRAMASEPEVKGYFTKFGRQPLTGFLLIRIRCSLSSSYFLLPDIVLQQSHFPRVLPRRQHGIGPFDRDLDRA
ncbi:MAG: hypothetical protein MZU84_02005 [Sphingobacterium sp.]|nr:hypothetical protein [Sphingobacterium sp.]